MNPPYTIHLHKKPPFLFQICIQNTYYGVDTISIFESALHRTVPPRFFHASGYGFRAARRSLHAPARCSPCTSSLLPCRGPRYGVNGLIASIQNNQSGVDSLPVKLLDDTVGLPAQQCHRDKNILAELLVDILQ